MVQVDVGRGQVQQRRELPLEADGDVAQPDRLVPGLQQGAGDDPDRVREVDDPGVRAGPPDPLGDVQHHRDRPQRLGEPARAGGLLPDAAALQRPGLVLQPGRLPADAQLEQHRVGALDARVEIGGGGDPSRMPLPGEDPPGQRADQLQPLGGGVDEHQLADRQGVAQPRESVDQLGCVGGTAAHHCEFHGHQPFTPVRVTPSTNAFWAKKKRTITGAMTSTVAAMVRFQFVW